MAIVPTPSGGFEDLKAWSIDRKHSYVGFEVKHMGFMTIRGVFHDYQATILISERDLARSRFSGTIAVASVDTRVQLRDEDLRSPNFFDAVRFPEIRYRSSHIETSGGNQFRVFGDLTIKDVTREIVLEGTYAGPPKRDPWGTLRTGFSASGAFDRKDFGMTWDVALPGGGSLVGATVTVHLDIELIPAQQDT